MRRFVWSWTASEFPFVIPIWENAVNVYQRDLDFLPLIEKKTKDS